MYCGPCIAADVGCVCVLYVDLDLRRPHDGLCALYIHTWGETTDVHTWGETTDEHTWGETTDVHGVRLQTNMG